MIVSRHSIKSTNRPGNQFSRHISCLFFHSIRARWRIFLDATDFYYHCYGRHDEEVDPLFLKQGTRPTAVSVPKYAKRQQFKLSPRPIKRTRLCTHALVSEQQQEQDDFQPYQTEWQTFNVVALSSNHHDKRCTNHNSKRNKTIRIHGRDTDKTATTALK